MFVNHRSTTQAKTSGVLERLKINDCNRDYNYVFIKSINNRSIKNILNVYSKMTGSQPSLPYDIRN